MGSIQLACDGGFGEAMQVFDFASEEAGEALQLEESNWGGKGVDLFSVYVQCLTLRFCYAGFDAGRLCDAYAVAE